MKIVYGHQWPIGGRESHTTTGHWRRFKSHMLIASYQVSTAVSQQLEGAWSGRQQNTAVINAHHSQDNLAKVKHVFTQGNKHLGNDFQRQGYTGNNRCYVTTNMSLFQLYSNIIWRETRRLRMESTLAWLLVPDHIIHYFELYCRVISASIFQQWVK